MAGQAPGLLGGLLGVAGGALGGTVDDLFRDTLTTVHEVTGTGDVGVADPLLPIEDVVGPVFTGGSASGGVTVTAPLPVPQAAPARTPAPAPVKTPADPAVTPDAGSPVKVLLQVRPRGDAGHGGTAGHGSENESTRVAGGGSGGGGGLPAAPSAPSAPVSFAGPGHDGPGGVRLPFAIATDGDTVTQLKLIGVSRDHEVDGAGRDAALPTTSPD
ncbi:hypothetical protein [Amycolatopsis ultiminotia]|uniref:hypothetical protein n=1 Tax=Amycolatopsis ultiminotia TaxID=543629 RepID=UPI0031EFE799